MGIPRAKKPKSKPKLDGPSRPKHCEHCNNLLFTIKEGKIAGRQMLIRCPDCEEYSIITV